MRIRTIRRFLYGAVLVAFAAVAVAGLRVGELNWRAHVVGAKFAGKLDDLSWAELARWIRPGSPVYLGGLADDPNPFSAISNSFSSTKDQTAGSDTYASRCSQCHGPSGEGATAPSLFRPKRGASDWALFRTIERGVPEKAMPPSGLDERSIWQLVAYIRSLTQSSAGETDENTPKLSFRPVTSERLLAATSEPENWLLQNGSYTGQRFSGLEQVDRSNAYQLGLIWAYALDTTQVVETIPLVNDGIMYLTEPPNTVLALDAATGEQLWRYEHRLQTGITYGYGIINRGVALLDDAVYMATLDARVIALDAHTGKVLWTAESGDPTTGHNFTSAPLAVGGKIIVGIAGGDHGANGYIEAYDAKTGERLWKFETVPSPGEPGNESWGTGDAWRHGGAVAWGIGSYDPESNLLYWGIGNPAPDHNGDVRPGDNLYSNSVVALNADTGKLVWHFQFTPHGTHDWDSVQVPVLADFTSDGGDRKLMLWANRNAFYYVLDRETGKFLTASPFAKQTWADGIDDNGRPKARPEAEPSAEGTLAWPSATGATNWWPPAYDPGTQVIYVPTLEQPGLFFKGEQEFKEGTLYLGTGAKPPSALDYKHVPSIRAIDALSGQVRWQHDFPARTGWSQVGGVLATAGGLLFVGDYQSFYALDADNGAALWRVRMGSNVNAAPVTFAANGRQYVSLAAGNTLFTFALPKAPDR